MTDFLAIESKAQSGEPLTRDEAERLMDSPDLIEVGRLAEAARKAHHGDVVTYGRVCQVERGLPGAVGEAGEVRLVGTPTSADEALRWVRAAAQVAGDAPLTGFSLADLAAIVSGDHLVLAALAGALAADGLEAVAEVPLDALGETEHAIEVVRAIRHGGLGAWRATIGRAAPLDRLRLIERAAAMQRELGAFRAFAPLPRQDAGLSPATGFDDVRTIAAARLVAAGIPTIQVDWPLYGPKLAQVALAFGADDIDGVAPTDTLNLGPRRSPVEDIERQIRAAFAEPRQRNGRYERRS